MILLAGSMKQLKFYFESDCFTDETDRKARFGWTTPWSNELSFLDNKEARLCISFNCESKVRGFIRALS